MKQLVSRSLFTVRRLLKSVIEDTVGVKWTAEVVKTSCSARLLAIATWRAPATISEENRGLFSESKSGYDGFLTLRVGWRCNDDWRNYCDTSNVERMELHV